MGGVELSPMTLSQNMATRNILKGITSWPIGADGMVVVPYRCEGAVNLTRLEPALRSWEKDSCVRFREMAASEKLHDTYLLIRASTTQCRSTLGVHPKATLLKITDSCGVWLCLAFVMRTMMFT
ncbi:uncharacterized protein LOC108673667 [Hyalella azteca]|uniref:Uncharacterized protein LOC108673667 n=1 Tax=Hyalella azteca TaxID=294128 RepID=A0A8B7NTD1_HYAAZ|nr:uncharacterized protein LOC108673667 [Hyalella azteca]